MRQDTWIEELPTELTPTEREQRGRELARTECALAELKDQHVDEKKRMKAAEDKLATKSSTLARAVDTGREKRAIACYESPDVRRFQINVIRMDTGEVVRSRAMDKHEREGATQGSLFERDPVDLQAQRTARAAVTQAQREAGTVEKPTPLPAADATVVDDEVLPKPRERPMQRRARQLAEEQAAQVDDYDAGTIDNPNPMPEPIPTAED